MAWNWFGSERCFAVITHFDKYQIAVDFVPFAQPSQNFDTRHETLIDAKVVKLEENDIFSVSFCPYLKKIKKIGEYILSLPVSSREASIHLLTQSYD